MAVAGNIAQPKLTPYVSPAAAWALALGTSIGWGSLVITSNTYLSQAGPLGSILGIGIGGIIMLVISRNYHYMMNACPDAGGAYAYSRDAFGHDHGFLTAWFLALTYLAMLWANATSLPLFSRMFLGDQFEFGYLYSLFGYDVYFGEALLSIAAIVIVGLFLMRFKRVAANLMIGLVALFSIGITVCFAAAMLGLDIPIEPLFVPSGSEFAQIVLIACISPWAFIGFENISHAAEEFTFPHKRVFRILVVVVITTTLLYVFVTLLSVTAFPAGYANWTEYIADHGNLSGIEALPPFYAAYHYLGDGGVGMLILSLLCLIITSLIGNILALSRLFFALGRDSVIPHMFADLNAQSIPWKAIALAVGISCIVPFLGRTAIGWIVDVTTIGATIIYGFVSASTWKTAKFRGDKIEECTGIVGLVVMVGFALYLLVPNLFTTGSMAAESYFLFVVWAILGFVVFRLALRRDRENRFGGSIIVWVGLLSLVLFVSLVWMSQSNMAATVQAMSAIEQHYVSMGIPAGSDDFVAAQLDAIRYANVRSIIVVVLLFALSLGVLLTNYSTLSKRARESEEELSTIKLAASTDALTGVKNKRAFDDYTKYHNARIASGEEGAFAVAVCDVNGLKHVNDTQGHKAGDEYIKAACRLICETFQHSPVFRIGGDEFVAVLAGRDFEDRQRIIAEMNERVEANIACDAVVVATGISDFQPDADTTMQSAFERADALMYKRKQELKAMGARTR